MRPQLVEGNILPCMVVKSRTQDDCYVVMVIGTEYIGLLPRDEAQFQYYQGSVLWATLSKMMGWKNLFTQKSEQYVKSVLNGIFAASPIRVLKVAGAQNAGFWKVLVSHNELSDRREIIADCVRRSSGMLRRHLSDKVTFVPMSLDPEEQIVNALLPGQPEDVRRVMLLPDENRAVVYVEPFKKAIFLGKSGLNVATAGKLTGWRIEIQ